MKTYPTIVTLEGRAWRLPKDNRGYWSGGYMLYTPSNGRFRTLTPVSGDYRGQASISILDLLLTLYDLSKKPRIGDS